MMRTIALAAALAALGGCALVPFRHHHRGEHRDRPVAAAPAPALADGGVCKLDLLKVLEGRPGSAVLAAQALDLSGARTVRWLHPGDVATMDFRQDRLNIRLTRDNIVKGFACG